MPLIIHYIFTILGFAEDPQAFRWVEYHVVLVKTPMLSKNIPVCDGFINTQFWWGNSQFLHVWTPHSWWRSSVWVCLMNPPVWAALKTPAFFLTTRCSQCWLAADGAQPSYPSSNGDGLRWLTVHSIAFYCQFSKFSLDGVDPHLSTCCCWVNSPACNEIIQWQANPFPCCHPS